MNNIPELSLEPKAPQEIGRCIVCGEEIYANELHFFVDEGMVHGPNDKCFFPYLIDHCSVEEIAAAMHIQLRRIGGNDETVR